MSTTMQINGGYSVKKDSFVALEGDKITSLNLLIQGRLDVYISSGKKGFPAALEDLKLKSYRLFDLGQNIFFGANDLLLSGKNSLSLVAATECGLYAYEAENTSGTMTVIHNQRDYGAYVINSLCILIDNSLQALQKINAYRNTIDSILYNLCIYYMAVAEEYDLTAVSGKVSETGASGLAFLRERNVQPPVFFVRQYVESDILGSVHTPDKEPETQKEIDYYIHMLQIPADIKKAFFGADRYIASAHIAEASACLDHILLELRESIGQLEETIELLYSDHEDSVYETLMKAACEMEDKELDFTSVSNATAYILDKLKNISAYLETEYGHYAGIDLKYAAHMHMNAMSALENKCAAESISSVSAGPGGVQSLPDELNGSAERILEYAGLPEEKATRFMMNLTAFRNLKDKFSIDNPAKQIRNALSDLFFEIYPAVFRKAYDTKDNSRLIRMFLSYGYMDEKLLDHSQIMDIYKLAGIDHSSGAPNIYYMQEWFSKIYSMEKDPSVSHFGYDYADTFRELKKRGALTDKDKTAYFQNREDRLAFEDNNMFRQNHKICHGQINTYTPILHRDMAPKNPIRSHVTPARIQEKLNRILEVDFSAFHREINYMDTNKGIEKELVMMQVIPDFILVPVFGTRAMMWQEISGRVKSTPGRLLLPVFTDENLDDMLLKLIGNFRWELCRTMMGMAWNDVTQSSLTSDYSDYIEFYRKNQDLTEEAREKVKSLKARHNNKLRDIFTSEYEMWINYESKGNPRLNKVARGVLLKHCPFSKGIREQLERQPIFSEYLAAAKHRREKQARELENHYKYYIKQNGSLDPVLQKNLEFYRDL